MPGWGDCLLLYYMVNGSGLGSFGRDLVFVQDATEMDDFGGRQINEFFLLQAAQYFNGKELLSFLCGFGCMEELQKQLLCRYLYLKFFVGLRQNSLLRALKQVAFVSLYFVHGLGNNWSGEFFFLGEFISQE